MAFNHTLSKQLTSPFRLRLWMLKHLPMGLLTGMVIEELNEQGCTVVLKDRWWIRNPFGSVFWAVMGMAAELSTGALVYAYTSGTGVKFILVGMEARFFKKARGKSYYFCGSGLDVFRNLENIMNIDDTSVVIMPVTARDHSGQNIAEFSFHWQLRKPIN